jgi:hypothetical protein
MKTFSLIPAFGIAAYLLTSNALAQSPFHTQPGFPTLLKDPADTLRIVNGTWMKFDSDGTYHFTIEYSTVPDQPALRLIIYRPKHHPPATDCFTALCWEEDVFSSSGEGGKRQFDKEIKKGSELLVVAWEGGSSKARGGDPVDPDCPPNAPCGVPLSSTADRSKLQLTMTHDSQRAILEIERRRH